VLVTIEQETAALVRASQRGDRAAFGAIYQQYARMIHGILLAHVPFGDAEDVMQDVFIRAMRQVDSLREPAAVGGWLATIARHAATDYRRKLRPVSELTEVTASTRPPADAFEALEILQTLPPTYRETLILRLVEGMTGPEIAEKTGLTPESVRVNLCRGMKLLREKLK
jgi:RNA polymerase sigma-70 factor (ECF subfamily)